MIDVHEESEAFGIPFPGHPCKFVAAKGKHLWMSWRSANFGFLTSCAGCGCQKPETS